MVSSVTSGTLNLNFSLIRNTHKFAFTFILVSSLTFFYSAKTYALDCSWVGGNGNWTDNNWNGCLALFPDSDDRAIISSGVITLDQNIILQGFDLSGGGVTGANDLTSGSASWTGGSMLGTGTTQLNGDLLISGDVNKALGQGRVLNTTGTTSWGGNTAVNGNRVQLQGTTTINNSGIWNDSNGFDSGLVQFSAGTKTFNNSGTYNKQGNSITTFDMAMNNTGQVNVDNGTLQVRLADYVQTSGQTRVNSVLAMSGLNNTVELQGGTLTGTGTIRGLVNNTGGIVAPGQNTGVLTIENDYNQANAGTLAIEIAGLLSGTEFDVLNITGNAMLDGTLNVSLLNSYMPSLGDSFDVLFAEDISGEFMFFNLAALDQGLRWDVLYMTDPLAVDFVRLTVSAVPIPGAVWLFGSALVGLISIGRRRRKFSIK